MTGRPVNIAEFRCRAMRARTAECALRISTRPTGLKVVDAASTDTPIVFDIGMARDAQRFRRRAGIRTVSIQNRAEIIRFGEGRRLAAKHALPSWPAPGNSPFDMPPAA